MELIIESVERSLKYITQHMYKSTESNVKQVNKKYLNSHVETSNICKSISNGWLAC